ncbi:Sphingosine-1-phosphate lyase 1 [Trichinella patagoniensis]|uniref:sphinganine-1-phosphate aldolase n=1 Tax=Trichinella patagoniensis TaxID=990121 RepID=A0A0V1A708_9BILA|nr:Sphingosine-1-phosphate lyase 1 [Trichinella patagoniensis]
MTYLNFRDQLCICHLHLRSDNTCFEMQTLIRSILLLKLNCLHLKTFPMLTNDEHIACSVLESEQIENDEKTIKGINQTEDEIRAICLVGSVAHDDKLKEVLKTVFNLLVYESEKGVEYISQKDVAFVLENFCGPDFNYLYHAGRRIFGPTIIFESSQSSAKLPIKSRPLYCNAMKEVTVCFAGLHDKKVLSNVVDLVHHMGGSVRKNFTMSVTHVVTNTTQSSKYRLAVGMGKAVMHVDWIFKMWERRSNAHVSALSPDWWFWLSIQLDICANEDMYTLMDKDQKCRKRSKSPAVFENKRHAKRLSEFHGSGDLNPFSSHCSSLDVSSDYSSMLGDQMFSSEDLDNLMKSPKKGMSKRQQIAVEMLQTEFKYVQVLHTIITIYKEPLESPDSTVGGHLLDSAEMKLIFGNLPPIYVIHQKLHKELANLIAHWSEDRCIGNVWLQHLVKAYPPFVNFYERTKETLNKCDKSKPRFHAFLKARQNRPESNRESLQELIIRPVQRLPSVILLLSELLKNTDKANKDYQCIAKAIDALKRVLTHINEDKRKTEGQVKLFDIVNEIENCPPYLLSSQRQFITSISVTSLSHGFVKKGSQCVFYLFNDCLELVDETANEARRMFLEKLCDQVLKTVGRVDFCLQSLQSADADGDSDLALTIQKAIKHLKYGGRRLSRAFSFNKTQTSLRRAVSQIAVNVGGHLRRMSSREKRMEKLYNDIRMFVFSCFLASIHLIDWCRRLYNVTFGELEPWQISAYTFCAFSVFLWLDKFFHCEEAFVVRLEKTLFRTARRLPWVKRKISVQLSKTRQSVQMELQKNDPDPEFIRHLPDRGFDQNDIIAKAERYQKAGTFDFSKGKVSGAVYNANVELLSLNAEIMKLFCWSNPLHPDIFPGIRKMEAEIVRMVCNMFNGGNNACGTVTSGGTESLILACLAYRNRAYGRGNKDPEIVVPISAHGAFDKAAQMLRLRIRHVPLEAGTFKVDLDKMKQMITKSTCMLVASAPNFPYGIIDPIEQVAALGEKFGIPVHVDCCLGGFLLPFMERADYPLDEEFDFRIRGVTSISCDTHKYGFSTKGTSVLMYRNKLYQRYQYFCQPNWPGGIYATATVAGSRNGANSASCWATMLHFGIHGYVQCTRKIIRTARYIERKLREVKGIYIFGHPRVSVVAFTSYVFDIYAFASQMGDRGWSLNLLQLPPAVHFCITMNQTQEGVAHSFIEDATAVAEALLEDPSKSNDISGAAALYGSSQTLPDRTLVNEIACAYLDACYATETKCDPDDLDGLI